MNVQVAAQKRLVIIGATGMVGGYALRYALNHPATDRPDQRSTDSEPGRSAIILSIFRRRSNCRAQHFRGNSPARELARIAPADLNLHKPLTGTNLTGAHAA